MNQPFSNPDAINDRTPPQSIDAEEMVIGGILLDSDAIGRVADILTPDAFYFGAHRQIYEAALDLAQRGGSTDFVMVLNWLRDRDLLDKVGGPQKITELLDRTVSAVNIDAYAQLIAQKYTRRKLLAASQAIAALALEEKQPLPQVLDSAEQALFAVTQSSVKQDVAAASEILAGAFLEVEAQSLGQATPGLVCGFYDLDTMTQGFQRGDLVIVAGRPSMGKTAWSVAVGRNVAAITGQPVAIFSLEMSKEQLINRLLSGDAQIEAGRLRSGHLSEGEWERIGEAINAISSLKLFIDDTPNITVNEIRSKCRRMQAESGGLGMVILDYLQLMEGDSDNRVQALSKITRSLKGLARELGVPILVLSQLSRGVESRTDKRPVMSDLRDSGAIEQDGDLIVMLYREEYYNPDTPDRGVAEVLIKKHRNGPTGTVRLLFEPQYTRFRNLAGGQGFTSEY